MKVTQSVPLCVWGGGRGDGEKRERENSASSLLLVTIIEIFSRMKPAKVYSRKGFLAF